MGRACGPTGARQGARGIARSRTSRWRTGVLIGIHLLFGVHLAHWLVAGSTLSPVEPSEAMETLATGAINAGFIFFALAILSTMLLGRFFCGWGCHMVAMQDLCAWLLRKLRIRPRLVRTRTLWLVPFIAGWYMFLWPTFHRLVLTPILERSWPQGFEILGRSQPFAGWSNHLVREEFWATFPGPGVAVVSILVCGFLVVALLGSKAFCTYGCPYGAFFLSADRLAPGRIVADLARCERCGHCSASCSSNVLVHKEIQAHRRVVDANCMKCLDCVSVCPNDALRFGFGRPALFGGRVAGSAKPKRRFDTTGPEELAIWVVGWLSYEAVHGIYGALAPFLLSLGVAICASFLFWKCVRLVRDRDVGLFRFSLERDGVLRPAGRAFWAVALLVAAFILHCGVWKLLLARAEGLDGQVRVSRAQAFSPFAEIDREQTDLAGRAIRAFRSASGWTRGGWGLAHDPRLEMRFAWLYLVRREHGEAERHLREAIALLGSSESATVQLARIVALQQRPEEAERILADDLAGASEHLAVRDELFQLYLQTGRPDDAERLYRAHFEREPRDAARRVALARRLLAPAGRGEEARAEIARAESDLRAALAAAPDDVRLHRLLATLILLPDRRLREARETLAEGLTRAPDDPALLAPAAAVAQQLGDTAEAIALFERLARATPADPRPAGALAELLGRGAAADAEAAARWRTEAERRQAAAKSR